MTFLTSHVGKMITEVLKAKLTEFQKPQVETICEAGKNLEQKL